MTVKRGLDQENQPRSKRTRQDFSKKAPTGESTESSEGEEGEDSETGSQASGTSHTTGTAPATPTSGKGVIEVERGGETNFEPFFVLCSVYTSLYFKGGGICFESFHAI